MVGYSPWGRKELDMTERLQFSLVIRAEEPQLETEIHFSILDNLDKYI